MKDEANTILEVNTMLEQRTKIIELEATITAIRKDKKEESENAGNLRGKI